MAYKKTTRGQTLSVDKLTGGTEGRTDGQDLLQEWQTVSNKAGYKAHDAPSMRTFHLRKKHGTYGRTDRRTDGQTDGRTDGRTDL